jgi:intracellular septation protein A
MDVICIVFLWRLNSFLVRNRSLLTLSGGVVSLFGLIFRQTRSRIVSTLAASVYLAMKTKQVTKMFLYAFLILTVIGGFIVFYDTDFIADLFVTSYENVSTGTGTWSGRQVTMEIAMQEFKEHMAFGTGSFFLRHADTREEAVISYHGDLGYHHWLKSYGLMGLAWLFLLLLIFLRSMRRRQRDPFMSSFGKAEMLNIFLNFVTIPYFFRPEGICVVCLALATPYIVGNE